MAWEFLAAILGGSFGAAIVSLIQYLIGRHDKKKAGEITETGIREDWREDIVRRASAASSNTDTYTREALEAMTNADLEIILAGMGVSANMTKANMVTLILAMQGGEAL